MIREEAGKYPSWFSKLSTFGTPDRGRAIGQILDTFIPYVLLWVGMVYTLRAGYSYGITLLLSMIAALFLIRIFIIFHDCTHSSFWPNRRINTLIGYISGILTFTPFWDWGRSHAKHHMTVGNLDKRGTGDVWMITVEEYRAASKGKKFLYRFYRNPFVMFLLGPIFIFLLSNRLPTPGAGKKEKRSVWITNGAILGIILLASYTIGLKAYVLIQLPTIWIAGIMGVWLFYVQHNFVPGYWAREGEWDRIKASLEGSSYYKLPRILQWFSGNIGIHHVHHLRPSIPNYKLQACYDSIPELQEVKFLTLRDSLQSLKLRFWDEQRRRMVGLEALKTL